ncbi:MAG: 1-deoxy-D-xylulose-5-phosphate reductoisomerase [Chloroflexi bacterium]|nr:1-deoxy-D-xylulose-5-phosphate reductoisomerase [Chloroflexota bacterium]
MMAEIKRIVLLGSTGSIGRQTLDVVRAHPDRLKVLGLSGGRNAALIAQQLAEFRPAMLWSEDRPGDILPARWVPMAEMVTCPDADVVVVATSGTVALEATLAAVRAGKLVAIANKEVLVLAGSVLTAEAQGSGGRLLPIDSEHSAIWQCVQGEAQPPARLILTASGGPLRDNTMSQLERVTPAEALRHPTWQMGRKVTVDSATLMNKGLEVIEAHWLFGMPYERIDIVMHRESIVHSLVELADGSVKAQLGRPDMRAPIQYALSYPERWENPTLPRLELTRCHALHFGEPDVERFPCLGLALEAGRQGGTYPAVLVGADEAAVNLFLEKRIGFLDIGRLVGRAIGEHRAVSVPDLEALLAAQHWAREQVNRWAGSRTH